MFHISSHTNSFNQPLLNYMDQTTTYPTGTWSKASDTAKILEFNLYMCEVYQDTVPKHNVWFYIQLSCQSVRDCMQASYDSDLWLDPRPTAIATFIVWLSRLAFAPVTSPGILSRFSHKVFRNPMKKPQGRSSWRVASNAFSVTASWQKWPVPWSPTGPYGSSSQGYIISIICFLMLP